MNIKDCLLKVVIIAVIISGATISRAFDTIELEPLDGVEYTFNGIKYLLKDNGEAQVYMSVREKEHVVIPNSVTKGGKTYTVTSIGECAFLSFEAVDGIPTNPILKSVVLPNTIKELGDYAFRGCRYLESINMPNSIQVIGVGVFENCQKLKSITFPKGITKISPYAFMQCYSLKTIEIPFSVGIIEKYAFHLCENLENVKILNPNTKIYDTAFSACDKADLGEWNGELLTESPKTIVVVFDKDGVVHRAESTSIWLLFKTKEEAAKHYIGEYILGQEKETFIKRDSLIYW